MSVIDIDNPRELDLTKNYSDYKSAENLLGSWSFNGADARSNPIILTGKSSKTEVSASMINATGIPVDIPQFLFQTPADLKGINFINKASITVDNTAADQADQFGGIEVTDYQLPEVATTGNIKRFTFSVTFQIPQVGSKPLGAFHNNDAKICIATIADTSAPNGRVGIYYDHDGYANNPALMIAFHEDENSGILTKTFTVGILNSQNERWNDFNDVRGWVRLDLVVDDLAMLNATDFLNGNGGRVYVNGLQTVVPDAGATVLSIAGANTAHINKTLVGGTLSNFAGLVTRNRIRIAGFDIWDENLQANEISTIYNSRTNKKRTGNVSNPARVGEACGECEHDTYPTIRRSADQRRLGNRTPAFSDLEEPTTLPAVGSKINYPTLFESGAMAAGALGTLIPTPNTLPTLYGTASFTGSQGRANIVNSYKKCGNYTNFSDSYKPFNDTQAPVNIGTQQAFLDKETPGFSPQLGNRIIIDIDIGTTSDTTLKIISGNNGDPFGDWGKINKSERGNTGLYYYNFRNRNFSGVGSNKFETSERVNWWAAPGQMSASKNSLYFADEFKAYANQDLHGVIFDLDAEDANSGPLWWRTSTIFYDDWSAIPRIFQPYPATVAHRQTFHHLYGPFDYNPTHYPIGKTAAFNQESGSVQTLHEALKNSGLYAGGTMPGLFRGVADKGFGGNAGFIPSGSNEHTNAAREFIPYSNDVAGIGWATLEVKGAPPESRVDRTNNISSRIWNDPQDLTSSLFPEGSLQDAFERTFSVAGRPISYTNWCQNSIFHATSSQTVKMSDHINAPFLLEAFEVVDVEVEAVRRQEPFTKTYTSPTSGLERIAAWSNTNNHIDMLTFFLLKQGSNQPNIVNKAIKEKASRRELVSFSTHVFASPYVGWDWIDGTREHTYTASLSVPMCGARMSRVFQVTEDTVKKNVPGVDSFQHYKNTDGSSIGSHGTNGIFFERWSLELNNAGSLLDSGGGTLVTENPQPKWVSSSLKLPSVIAPVRVVSAYAQKTVPVLPMNQCTVPMANIDERAAVTPSGGVVVTGSFYNSHFWYSTELLSSLKVPSFVFRGLHSTQKCFVRPRPYLPCMGVSWGGGTKSELLRIPTLLQLYSASRGMGVAEGNESAVENRWTLPETFYKMPTAPAKAAIYYTASIPSNSQIFSFEQQGAAQISRIASIDTRPIIKARGLAADPKEEFGFSTRGPARFSSGSIGVREYRVQHTPGGHYGLKKQLGVPVNQERDNGAVLASNLAAGSNFATVTNVFPTGDGYGGPHAVSTAYSGSLVKNSGYLFLPEDELIFGMQWMPADSVHRSFTSIDRASQTLSFVTMSATDSGPSRNWLTGAMVPAPEFVGAPATNDREEMQLGFSAPEIGQQYYRAAGFCESNSLVNASKARCVIKKKPMKLRLYGSLLKNLTQKPASLPQQLTTDCIHEVIGNEPILDQFDLTETHEMLTSTAAKVISGSMRGGIINVSGSETFGTWDLARSFSKSSLPLNRGRGVRLSYLEPAGRPTLTDMGNIKRVNRMPDLAEYYYDSLAPDVRQMFAVDGCRSMLISGSLGLAAGSVLSSDATQHFRRGFVIAAGTQYPQGGTGASTAVAGQEFPAGKNINFNWSYSFPFEPKYSAIDRRFRQNVSAIYHYTLIDLQLQYSSRQPLMYSASCQLGGAGSKYAQVGWTGARNRDMTGTGLARAFNYRGMQSGASADNGLALEVAPATVGRCWKLTEREIKGTTSTEPLASTAIVRADFPVGGFAGNGSEAHRRVKTQFALTSSLVPFFGIGDNKRKTLDHEAYYLSCSQGNSDAAIHEAYLLARKPRGYKYGLISAEPIKLCSVYRRDAFGQFRDMLEQRPYTAIYAAPPVDVKMRGNRRTRGYRPGAQSTTPAVTCQFRQRVFDNPAAKTTTVKVAPAETQCSNLSNAATSSLPYFDGLFRNRDSAPTVDEEIIIT